MSIDFHRKLNNILEGIKLSPEQRLDFDWDNDSDDDIIGFNDVVIKEVENDFGTIFSIFRRKKYDDSHKVVGVRDSNKNTGILKELNKYCKKLNSMSWIGSTNMKTTSASTLDSMKAVYSGLTALGKSFIPKLDNIVDNAIIKIRDGSVDQDNVMHQINHVLDEISNLKVRNKDDNNIESKLFRKGANSILGAMRGKHKNFTGKRGKDSDRAALKQVDDHTNIDRLIELATGKLIEHLKTTDLYDIVFVPDSSSKLIRFIAERISDSFGCQISKLEKIPRYDRNGNLTKVSTHNKSPGVPFFDLAEYKRITGDDNNNPRMHPKIPGGELSTGIPKSMKSVLITYRPLWHNLYRISDNDDNIMGKKILIIDDSYDSGTTIKMCMETLSFYEPSLIHGYVVFDLSTG